MRITEDMVGKDARLPDGQLVMIEKVYPDGQALVRRVEHERAGSAAICSLEKLRPAQS